MSRGADVWAHPVSYDKLAVKYRRWRNSGQRAVGSRVELLSGPGLAVEHRRWRRVLPPRAHLSVRPARLPPPCLQSRRATPARAGRRRRACGP